MNQLRIVKGKIILHVPDPADWPIAEYLAGSMKNPSPGVFEYSAGALNLQRIYQAFQGPKRPEVIEGHWIVDKERERHMNYNQALNKLDELKKLERYPVEPNGKFVPYAHQTKIIGTVDVYPYAAIAADCFLPDTQVLSQGRYRNIEEIERGDSIFTLKGPSTVEKTMHRAYSGEVICVKTGTGFFPLKVTPNHQFYVLRRERCVIPSRANTHCSPDCNRSCPLDLRPFATQKIELVQAADLTESDCLLFPQGMVQGKPKKVKNAYLVLMGYWLAEGWFRKNDSGEIRGLEFGFHRKEEKTHIRELKIAAKKLGLRCRLNRAPSKPNVTTVSIKDSKLANQIFKDCGEYSCHKYLPDWAMNLSRRQKITLLTCMIKGDGTIHLAAPSANGRLTEHIKYTTVSYAVASRMRDMLLSLGVPCSATVELARVDKVGQERKEIYRLLINRKFMNIFGYPVKTKRTCLRQIEFVGGDQKYTLCTIRKIWREQYKGFVYNLTSAGHDSYLTDGGISKNCGLGKTGSLAREIEIQLQKGSVVSGKILITAPLSILETSWLDDIKKFTNLRACVLWQNITNKDILGEEEVIHDYGDKPLDVIAVKTKTKNLYRNSLTKAVVERVTVLERAQKGEWVKYKAKIKYGTNSSAQSVPFGPVTGRTCVKENTKLNKIKELLSDKSYDVFLINHDGVKTYEKELAEHEFAWVIVDESTKIKNPTSQIHQAHVAISWRSKFRNILSGTPNPNGFIDLWGQFYFLDRGLTLEPSLRDYLKEYFTALKVGNFGGRDAVKYIMRSEEDKNRLIARVRRAGIWLKQRDCIDLPPRTDMRRVVRMSGAQERAYLEMEEELITEFLDRKTMTNVRAEAVNVLSKMMKLRQITAGYLAGADGLLGKFDSNPKLDDLDDFIEELGEEKLVIACQFKEEIRTVLDRYKERGIASVEGDVLVKKRNENIRSFQNSDELQIIVLQPQAAAHGITLTNASRLLFLSLDYNFEYYYQTAKRIERIGQTKNIFVIHSLAALSDGSPTIDHDLIDILAQKSKDRDALFDEGRDVPDIAAEMVNRLRQRVEKR